jgi:hypothetical protein
VSSHPSRSHPPRGGCATARWRFRVIGETTDDDNTPHTVSRGGLSEIAGTCAIARLKAEPVAVDRVAEIEDQIDSSSRVQKGVTIADVKFDDLL